MEISDLHWHWQCPEGCETLGRGGGTETGLLLEGKLEIGGTVPLTGSLSRFLA